MKCLVLGGNGFIGSQLVGELLQQGYFVRSFDLPGTRHNGAFDVAHPALELMDGDFTNEVDVCAAVQGCDVVFHLISTTLPKSSNLNPKFDVSTNLLGTIQLIEKSIEFGVGKFVFVSSGGTVYGTPQYIPIDESHPLNPLCSYGITKSAIEKYLEMFREMAGLDYSVVRLANPFGEFQRTKGSQGAVAVFLGKVLRGEDIEVWGDGSVVRDYVYSKDVIRALLAAMNCRNNAARIFNIGSGCGISLLEALDVIEQVTKTKAKVAFKPGRSFDVPVNILNVGLATEALAWRPNVTFAEGVERFSAWLKADESRLN